MFRFKKCLFSFQCRKRLYAKAYISSKDTNITYLHVDYDDKDEVKKLGAQWDLESKMWYIMGDKNKDLFNKWQLIYLNVPYYEKDDAKKKGARWNAKERKWYISIEKSVDLPSHWFQHSPFISTVQVDNIAVQVESKKEYAFFFDIETNGFPVMHPVNGQFHHYEDIRMYDTSRIVQMSAMLCLKDNTLTKVETQDVIIKADNFPIENHKIHGITLERSLEEGVNFVHAAKNVIGPALLKSTCLVAHNADFDINIFKSELYRHELYELLEHMNKIKVVCTMKSTKDLIGSLNKFGKVKNPNLKELYTYATGREMENHHNSLYDVINLHEAISELLRSQRILPL